MDTSAGTYPEGEILAGKYRIDGVLGRGGMAVVYAAYHQMLAQPVALKVIRAESGNSVELMQRFINEARAVARLRNEHVVRVMDVGVLDDGAPYIVMERLAGMDLARTLESGGPVPVPLVVDYVLQALEAIAEAHANGIVHRDLKPANLFLAEEGRTTTVKVLDFGIFKATDEFGGLAHANTSASAILGTPGYMSPEQLRSSTTVDARTDIWSVGVILYELLAGAPPFAGNTVGSVFASVLEHVPPPLERIRPGLPAGLSATVEMCLEKDRERRHASVADLAISLLPFASPSARQSVDRIRATAGDASRTSDRVTVDPQPSAPHSASVQTAGNWASLYPRPTARAAGWASAVVGAAVLTVVVGIFYSRTSPRIPSTSASAPAPYTPTPPPSSSVAPVETTPASPPPTASSEQAAPPMAGAAPKVQPQVHSPSRPTPRPPPAATPGLATDRHW